MVIRNVVMSVRRYLNKRSSDKDSGWRLCFHCGRAYKEGEYKLVELKYDKRKLEAFMIWSGIEDEVETEELEVDEDGLVGEVVRSCPYPDCDGSVDDCFEWNMMRVDYPSLPRVPVRNKVYV